MKKAGANEADPELSQRSEDRVSLVEEGYWPLEDFDPNEVLDPDIGQEIIEIENLNKLTTNQILDLIAEYYQRVRERKRGQKESTQIEAAFSAYSKRLIQEECFYYEEEQPSEPNEMDEEENKDYSPTKEAYQQEAQRLRDLEQGSIIIHVDVKRAFDNINPWIMHRLIEIMAEEPQFKILKPFKNILQKWVQLATSERIKIDGWTEFTRQYGGPQGSLWTPSIWNLYLTSILANSPLKRMIRLYADNVFIWIDAKHVTESYIRKIMLVISKLLKTANMEINEDEIFVFWRGVRPEYTEIISKIIPIMEEQKILGYNFQLIKGQWIYKMKFWIPISPRRSLVSIPFEQRVAAFKTKAMGSIIYQIHGWYLFGRPEDKYNWKELNNLIRNAFINWVGIRKISYRDLASMGILIRPYLIDKLAEAACRYYDNHKEELKSIKGREGTIRAIKYYLGAKYLDEEISPNQKLKKLYKLGKNFTLIVAHEEDKFKHWIEKLMDQMEELGFSDEKYKELYWRPYEDKNLSKLANYQEKYSLWTRYKDEYCVNFPNNSLKWKYRTFWHLCLQKECNTPRGIEFHKQVTETIRKNGTWSQLIAKAMEIDIPKQMEKDYNINDYMKKQDWELLDMLYQTMDSPVANDLNWRRNRIIQICHSYELGKDTKYIDYFVTQSKTLDMQ